MHFLDINLKTKRGGNGLMDKEKGQFQGNPEERPEKEGEESFEALFKESLSELSEGKR